MRVLGPASAPPLAGAARCPCVCTPSRPWCVALDALKARSTQLHRWQVLARSSSAGGGADDEPPAGSGSVVPDTLPIASADSDWRTFRAQLVAASAAGEAPPAVGPAAQPAWAHTIPHPEQGCLLLANPLMFQTSQTYFYLSVILIIQHNEQGSMGLILNRPTEYKIGDLAQDDATGLQPEFNECRVYLGGDVDPGAVFLLHSAPECGGEEVIPGVHTGGLREARRGLAEGRFSPDQFKILTRYAGWGPGQLESECRRGVWVPVSASAGAFFSPPASATRAADSLWHHVAQLVGGPMARLSSEVRGETYPEIEQAAAGKYTPPEADDDAGKADDSGSSEDGGSGGSGGGGGGEGQQRQQRRSKLPEPDYRDGAGI